MHLSPEFGKTVEEIERDGFDIRDRIDMLLAADTPAATAKSIGMGTLGLAQSFSHQQPDFLVMVGDRYELLCAACAALPFNIPLAHISGGDITEGANDNQIRNAISKLSHLHFVSMQEHADRLIQMGEENWRIDVTH
jgi:UDP-hydrolysing UDP-N-acetyl-D-glucosamine 2-epimerase